MFEIAVALMLILHGPDGHDVRIAPEQITALHSPPEPRSKNYPLNANCLINLTDGKFIAVVETCLEVEQQLERIE